MTPWAFATLGVALLLGGLVAPSRLGPVFRAWMGFAHRLSRITTPVFLGVVFFVVLAPVGALMRLFRRRPLVRSRAAPTFWIARVAGTREGAGMEHQF